MSAGILLVGSTDPHLEAVLRACGMAASGVPLTELSALAAPDAVQPVVIVLDLRKHVDLPHAVAALKRHHPMTGIILVLDRVDPALLIEAMRAGVTEVVTHVTEDELRTAIGRLTALRPVPAAGAAKIFAFVGAKGGVGTTTVAVNVAVALARLDPGSTLLVDLHVANGDAAVLLGIEPRFSILDALENTHRLDDSFFRSLIARTKSGVDLLASSDRMPLTPVELRSLPELLEFAERRYRYVILDVPPLDATVLDALETATRIVVVVNQELPTLRSAGRITTVLRQRYGQERLQVVVSRADRQSDLGEEDVERVVGCAVKGSFPSDYRVALQAVNRGTPMTVGNHHALAGSLTAFARELSGIRSRPATAAPARFRLFGLGRTARPARGEQES